MKAPILPHISSRALREGELRNHFPEVHALEGGFEHNAWHDKEDFFNHTHSVVETLERVIDAHPEVHSYLDAKVGVHTRKHLLLLAALYHDVGKATTVKEKKDGTSSCPEHEVVSARMFTNANKRFKLKGEEFAIVHGVVLHHGEMHEVGGKAESPNALAQLVERHPNIAIELVLHALADTVPSHLRNTNRKEYDLRVKHLNELLKKLA